MDSDIPVGTENVETALQNDLLVDGLNNLTSKDTNVAPVEDPLADKGPQVLPEVNHDKLNSDMLQKQEELTRKSVRKKTQTTKGKENCMKTSISLMKSCNKRLKKQIDIVLLLLNGSNVESVNDEMNSIEKTYTEFMDSFARACGVVSEDAEDKFSEQYNEASLLAESTDNMYLDCKENVCTWLIQKEKENPLAPSSHRSSKSSSKSSHSSRSHKSRSSSSKKSGSSNVSNLSLRQKAKVASLKAEAEALKESKEKELSAELSRLNMKIRKAEAKEKVYSSQVADHDRTEKGVDSSGIPIQKHEHNHKIETPTIPSQFNPGDFVTTSQIQIAMMDMIQLQSAPKPDLDPFD